MGVRLRGPGEYEEARNEEQRAGHHWREPCFRHRSVVIRFEFAKIEPLVRDVYSGSNSTADQFGQEW